MGWDTNACSLVLQHLDFNPPIPCGMGLNKIKDGAVITQFQSTHPVWDGTHVKRLFQRPDRISIHPSRVGWDFNYLESGPIVTQFQSTHPVWDGTNGNLIIEPNSGISIHPSRVGWDQSVQSAGRLQRISIHPSRVGWDSKN